MSKGAAPNIPAKAIFVLHAIARLLASHLIHCSGGENELPLKDTTIEDHVAKPSGVHRRRKQSASGHRLAMRIVQRILKLCDNRLLKIGLVSVGPIRLG